MPTSAHATVKGWPPSYVAGGLSVCMPPLYEDDTEGTVMRWFKTQGEHLEKNEPLLEVSTDRADIEIPSPVTGNLHVIAVAEDETVAVGGQLAIIELDRVPAGVHIPPQLSEGMTITRWLIDEGERVEAGEPLLQIEHGFSLMILHSPAAGILRGIAVAEKGTAPPGAQVAIIQPDPADSEHDTLLDRFMFPGGRPAPA